MGRFVKVAKAADIAEGTARCFEIEDKVLAVFNLGGEFYAIADECPHAQGPLSEGEIFGEEVECPWHAARFNIKTGACLCDPADEDVACYQVRVADGDVEVEV